MSLRIRWLGRVPYRDAWAVQRGLNRWSTDDHLLLLEHPHVFTYRHPAHVAHVLVPPGDVDAELVRTDRGGDVTYHGPGQLVGYPIVTTTQKSLAYVRSIEQLLIDTLGDVGLTDVGRLPDYPGVWVDPEGENPRKIAAIGVRLSRGRTMHGFALNVDPDMDYWSYLIPCGIADKAVTSLASEGLNVTMRQVVDAVSARAEAVWGHGDPVDRQDVAWTRGSSTALGVTLVAEPSVTAATPVEVTDRAPLAVPGEEPVAAPAAEPLGVSSANLLPLPDEVSRGPAPPGDARDGVSVQRRRRLDGAGVTEGLQISTRKPSWLRSTFRTAPSYLKLKHTMRDLGLVTVCEEAGCPNIFECWADGTATFMINGERCTRACGFCLVDTRHPEPLDAEEPGKVAEAVERMGLSFAVVTAVARDDLDDGGAGAFAETIQAIRRRTPGVEVEVLIPDVKGDDASLATIFEARPDVLNHNVETVPRLQRAVRPSAGYARSLSVLARAKEAGLTTKSGLIVGMGETDDEVLTTLADLRGVGVDIVTIGQYLRPTPAHLPVSRWVEPATFEQYAKAGEALGIPHVESSPLTRSSYHAKQAAHASDSTAVAL